MSVKNRPAKRRRHERTCAGKIGHPKRDRALDALMSLGRRTGANTRNLRIYKCQVCKLWHFGHWGR